MHITDRRKQSLSQHLLILLCLTISVVALFSSRNARRVEDSANTQKTGVPGLVERIDSSHAIHAGYGVYPPYTLEDPNTREVSGFSVDVMNYIARELNTTVVWHRLNWNTMAADLKRGEYDVIADPIFQTIPRAREFSFSEPYAYFADGIAVVKVKDARFNTFDDLDQSGIVIAVGKGWASESLVTTRFKNATISPVQTSTDLLQVFNEVVSGRADVAVADGADAKRFVDEHSEKVKALWLDNPPAFLPAGFALRVDDSAGAEFLTIALRNMRLLGVLDAIAAKHGIILAPPPSTH